MESPWQGAAGTMSAEKAGAGHVRVELLAQETTIRPSQQLWLGVHFSLDKNWHIYWVNPGDSGQPPAFQWRLPPGFSAGAIQWPRPEKLQNSQLADYGYKDGALLLVPVQVPSSVRTGAREDIVVNAKWLVCREICLPGHAQLHLALPVSSSLAEDTSHSQLFVDAKKAWPKPWPRGWKIRAVSHQEDFVLLVRTGKPIQEAGFFPLESLQIENAAPQVVQANPRGATITLKKSEQLLQPISVLKGVLVLHGGNAYQIQAPVTQP